MLGSQRVLELSAIAQLDFLVPALFAYRTLALEWVYLRHRGRKVGKRYGKRGVGCTLRYVGGCRQRPFRVGETIGHVDRRTLGVLGERGGVVAVEVVARVAR